MKTTRNNPHLLVVLLLLAAALTAWGGAGPEAVRADTSDWIWELGDSLRELRLAHTATLVDLAGSGSGVLVVGGGNETIIKVGDDNKTVFNPKASCEFYAVSRKEFRRLKHPLNEPRALHTVTLLSAEPDREGKVLVVGGLSWLPEGLDVLGKKVPFYALAKTYELFDPLNPQQGWSAAKGLSPARFAHTATLLGDAHNDHKVLIAGGLDFECTLQFSPTIELKMTAQALKSCQVYDPKTDHWDNATSLNLNHDRALHTATLLTAEGPNKGKVLVTGGVRGMVGVDVTVDWAKLLDFSKWLPFNVWYWLKINDLKFDDLETLKSCELFDPQTGLWENATDLTFPRVLHTATPLVLESNKGRVLVAGGQDGFDNGTIIHRSYEIYDADENTWTCKSDPEGLPIPSSQHTATLLDDRTVLLVGGSAEPNAAQIYYPEDDKWALASDFLYEPQSWHTANVLPGKQDEEGKVLVAGGGQRRSELFGPPPKSGIKHRRALGGVKPPL
jgi:hypothetical protein